MNWAVWDRLEPLLHVRQIKPIVAVVPDNQDPALEVATANPAFWDRIRQWQAWGWSIALHGCQHVLKPAPRALVPLHRRSEFAGLPFDAQAAKIRSALDILAAQEIRPAVWAAPAHSFDQNTLFALKNQGLAIISDGFALLPHRDSSGMFWVPQQLWRLRPMPAGVWTVCLHVNAWGDQDVEAFEAQLDRFAPVFTSMPDIEASYRFRSRTSADALFAAIYPRLLLAKLSFRRSSWRRFR
jgi:hypothetical protein